MRGFNVETTRAAPVGATSALALAFMAFSCAAFRLLLQHPNVANGRWAAILLLIPAYFLFSPAVAGCLYSLLFERQRAFGWVGLGAASLTLLAMFIVADGLVVLPFWFLAIMGIVKFLRWRSGKPWYQS
jgi:hypothetical protein